MHRLLAQSITPAAFEPYGEVAQLPPDAPRQDFATRMRNLRPGAWPNFALIRPPLVIRPHYITQMERHAYTTQLFIPVDVEAYLVLVAPASDAGPDPSATRAFTVPPDTCVSYHAGTWHASMRVIGRPGVMAVIHFDDGTDDDCHFRVIQPINLNWEL